MKMLTYFPALKANQYGGDGFSFWNSGDTLLLVSGCRTIWIIKVYINKNSSLKQVWFHGLLTAKDRWGNSKYICVIWKGGCHSKQTYSIALRCVWVRILNIPWHFSSMTNSVQHFISYINPWIQPLHIHKYKSDILQFHCSLY